MTAKWTLSVIRGLLPYTRTSTQRHNLQTILDEGTVTKALKKLHISDASMYTMLNKIMRYAATQGYTPGYPGHNHLVPDGYHVKGVSELVDKDGKTKMKWVKSDKDRENLAREMEELLDSIVERVEGRAVPISKPPVSNIAKDMTVVVPMGDPHIGMYAWAREAEADFDCKVAEKLTIEAVEHLVDISPAAEKFILINLGDFFHSDNVDNETAHSKNRLDVDGRWAKVQEIGFWIMVRCIDRALGKYPEVIVHNAIGNHDEHTSQALGAVLSAWYRNEPRVTIIREHSKFWYYQWGDCMIGVHHGHTTKLNTLPQAMAAHQPKMWGDTKFRYYYAGHYHHVEKKEFPGVIVEQFRTLAPKDAWHWGNARFVSMRDMQSIHLHKRYGEVGRQICPVEYLEREDDDPTLT